MSLIPSLLGTDSVGTALHDALDGLSMRQNVIADNIANVDTPHFRASSVDFETSLRSAVEDGSVEPGALEVSTQRTQTPVGANDNNVDLRKETLAAMQTQFQYQIVARAFTDRTALIQTAAGAS